MVTQQPSPHAPSPGLGIPVPRTFLSPTHGPALDGITDLPSSLSSTTSPSISSPPPVKSGHQAKVAAQAAILQDRCHPTQDLVLPQLEAVAVGPRAPAPRVATRAVATVKAAATAKAAAMVKEAAMGMAAAVGTVGATVTAPVLVRNRLSYSSALMGPLVLLKTVSLFLSPPTRPLH